MKCASKGCGGPGNRTIYRRDLPSTVHPKRCAKHGWLWAIPCCALHHSTLRRCCEPGCTRHALAAGRCNPHRIQRQRQATVPWRHCPECLHCGRTLGRGNYSASGLCRRCYHLLDDTSAFQAELARLNALDGDDTASANLLLLVQHRSTAGAAKALGVREAKVVAWLDGETPGDMLDMLRSLAREAL